MRIAYRHSSTVDEVVADIIGEIQPPGADNLVAIGPLVEARDPGDAEAPFYFVTASADPEFFCLAVGASSPEHGEKVRQALVSALTRRRDPALVLMDFDDELEMARWCEAMWLSADIKEIRATIEAQRARSMH